MELKSAALQIAFSIGSPMVLAPMGAYSVRKKQYNFLMLHYTLVFSFFLVCSKVQDCSGA